MNTAYIVAAVIAAFFLLVILAYFVLRARARRALRDLMTPPTVELPEHQVPAEVLPERPFDAKLEQASEAVRAAPILSEKLGRTRGALLGKLGKFLGQRVTPEGLLQEWGELEEALLEGDVGIRTTETLLERVKARLQESDTAVSLRDCILIECEALLAGLPHGAPDFASAPKPLVISVVGVNGAGKTTTIGKLGKRFQDEGKQVLLAAGDTFRAAAIGQLQVWAERIGSQFVAGREGGDPGAVAFDAVTAGKARGMDVVLLDTAGRLHTKTNLMEELRKVNRVMKKVIPDAPHETWLVLDGTTGQNAINQAREFQKMLEVTGVVITKLDGTAKGGAILAVASELKLPIKFIGVGETVEDLVPFEPKPFIEAILGGK